MTAAAAAATMGERWGAPRKTTGVRCHYKASGAALSGGGSRSSGGALATEPPGRPRRGAPPRRRPPPADSRRRTKTGTNVSFSSKNAYIFRKNVAKKLRQSVVWCTDIVVSVCQLQKCRRPVRMSGERNSCRCCIFKIGREATHHRPPAHPRAAAQEEQQSDGNRERSKTGRHYPPDARAAENQSAARGGRRGALSDAQYALEQFWRLLVVVAY